MSIADRAGKLIMLLAERRSYPRVMAFACLWSGAVVAARVSMALYVDLILFLIFTGLIFLVALLFFLFTVYALGTYLGFLRKKPPIRQWSTPVVIVLVAVLVPWGLVADYTEFVVLKIPRENFATAIVEGRHIPERYTDRQHAGEPYRLPSEYWYLSINGRYDVFSADGVRLVYFPKRKFLRAGDGIGYMIGVADRSEHGSWPYYLGEEFAEGWYWVSRDR